ncbi:MAG: lamin tail domain-containing protein, partial [Chthoniobacteraceae bacterium]
EYRLRWADRVQKHMFNGGALTNPAWTARFNQLAAIVDQPIIAESARWGDAKRSNPFNKDDWINERNYLLGSYLSVRPDIVLSQLRADGLYPTVDAPSMSPFGGYVNNGSEVVMSGGTGTIYYMPDGSDPRLLGGGIKPGAMIYTSSTQNESLIATGATWKYKDDGSNQGTAWRQAGFNDASWAAGPAELGYGDGDEVTTVAFVDVNPGTAGVQKNATTYFRRTFTVNNVSGITSLNISLEYDDQAIVYINGNPVVNTGLPVNPAYNAYSGSAAPDENAYFTFARDAGSLVNGTNTIAVEVHQTSNSSSDISFDLSLTAVRSSTATPLILSGTGEKPLRVRAYSGGTWSALVDALFLINTEPASSANLAISEIMYNPAPPTPAEIAAGFGDADDFEYLEFVNIGTKNIDLMGLYLYGPISFDFSNSTRSRVLPPGGRILIASKRSAFEFRYGAGKPVAGSYQGHLSNGGEQIIVYSPTEETLIDVTYSDKNGWPTAADGNGYSLVRMLPGSGNGNASDPRNYRSSVNPGGSPGGSDAINYAAWKTANGVVSDSGDGDGDGFPAFEEYTHGGSVTVPDANRLPQSGAEAYTVNATTKIYSTVAFSDRFAADDVALLVETSPSLSTPNWTSNNVVFVSRLRQPDGSETVTFRAANPLTNAPHLFWRITQTIQSP